MAETPRRDPPDGPAPDWSDEGIDQVIGNLLRIGVIVSALVVAVGGMLFLAENGRNAAPNLEKFEPEELRGPGGILHECAAGNSRGLILLGLLLLIATPVARVIFSVAAFAVQRDLLYVLFTLVVLAVLLYSLFNGYFSE